MSNMMMVVVVVAVYFILLAKNWIIKNLDYE